MEVKECKDKIVCDVNGCSAVADFTISFGDMGANYEFHICKNCAKALCEKFSSKLKGSVRENAKR